MMPFEELQLTRQFINAIEELGFDKPTEIQEKAIPSILNGQQLIGIAPTGTGKTAAYGLPVLQTLKYAQGEHPRALIVVPTKELVIQVFDKLNQLAKFTDLRLVALYGGIGPKTQIEQVGSGCDLIVATPGRLMEVYLKNKLVLKNLKHFVLDEADRLMDMGFMPQLRSILEVIPRKRQNLLFSATFSERVEQLSSEFLEFPLKVEVAPQGTPVKKIEQHKIFIPNRLSKINYFCWLARNETLEKVIVFARTRETATAIFQTIENQKLGSARLLHANKGQNVRLNSFKDFQEGEIRFLVSTDIAARGIDIPDVSHVINFDVPMRYEDYVHRIGRTARAGKSGVSYTFFRDDDKWHMEKIEKLIGMNIPEDKWPDEIEKADYLPGERKEILKEIDRRKRQADPTFKGAFHEKKRKPAPDKKSANNSKKRRR